METTNNASEAHLIVCDNLVKIYKVADLEVVALQGLDLVVRRGELLGIVGVSGSGKSTLMNILGGLDRPSAGRVWVNGQDLVNMPAGALDHYRRTVVGFVWQQSARNLIPYLSARENVELPMTLAGIVGRGKRQWADELLSAVGLADRSRHRLSELSGGEQQRAAIAVALANKPRLLLGDEPTGEVDEATAATIYQIFKHLNQQFDLTILLVSHDPGIGRHVDRVVAIRDGKTAAETVRQSVVRSLLGEAAHDPGEEIVYEELAVLDSAGRLQVPKEYLDKFNIRGRARLELVDEGILIRPAPQPDQAESPDRLASELAQARKRRGISEVLRRWRDARSGKDGSRE